MDNNDVDRFAKENQITLYENMIISDSDTSQCGRIEQIQSLHGPGDLRVKIHLAHCQACQAKYQLE